MNDSIEDNLAIVTYIVQHRIYDVLSLLLKNINEEDWEKIMTVHDAGGFGTPQPSIAPVEE